jgi:hypothetical protein
MNVWILFDQFYNLDEDSEELAVSTIVERLYKVFDIR